MLCLALAVAGCSLTDQTPAYRYRLTVEVDTPDGVKTGSSVSEVDTEVAGGYSIPTPGRVTNRVRGEAVTVDLGEGRVLFALLRSEADIDWAGRGMYRLSPQYAGENALRDGYRNMLRHRPERTVPRHFSRADLSRISGSNLVLFSRPPRSRLPAALSHGAGRRPDARALPRPGREWGLEAAGSNPRPRAAAPTRVQTPPRTRSARRARISTDQICVLDSSASVKLLPAPRGSSERVVLR